MWEISSVTLESPAPLIPMTRMHITMLTAMIRVIVRLLREFFSSSETEMSFLAVFDANRGASSPGKSSFFILF